MDYIDVLNSSYQRKDNIIRFPVHIDTIINYDYCMYKNDTIDDFVLRSIQEEVPEVKEVINVEL